MYDQMNLPGLLNAISLPASESGPAPCAVPDGPTTVRFGPDRNLASLTARQAKEKGLLTSGTCAPPGTTLSSTANRPAYQSLVSRLRTVTDLAGSTLFGLTWKIRVTPSGRSICALRASVRRIFASVCIGQPFPADSWSTPTAHEGRLGYQNRRNGKKGIQKSMTTEVIDYFDPVRGDPRLASWNTPRATDGTKGGPNQGNGALAADVALAGWPTPMAGTPAQNGNNAAGNTDSSRKTVALASWASPRSAEAGPDYAIMDRPDSGGLSLQTQVALTHWTTPKASDNQTESVETKAARNKKHYDAGKSKGVGGLTLPMQASITGPVRLTASGQVLTGLDAGMESSGQLSPSMSKWLMGLPPIWDACAPTKKQMEKK